MLRTRFATRRKVAPAARSLLTWNDQADIAANRNQLDIKAQRLARERVICVDGNFFFGNCCDHKHHYLAVRSLAL